MDYNDLFLPGPVSVAGHPLTEFGAKMTWPTFQKTYDTEIFQGRGRRTMQALQHEESAMQMRARIDFWGGNPERVRNRSQFEALLTGSLEPVVIDILDGFWYKALLLSSTDEGTNHELITTVEYRFQVTRHTDPVSVTSEVFDHLIYNPGNVPKTDCVLTVPAAALDEDVDPWTLEVACNDSWIIHLPDSHSGDLVIDGVNKIITRGGANVTNKIQWTDFPYLVPGENNVRVWVNDLAGWGIPVRVDFTPTYE